MAPVAALIGCASLAFPQNQIPLLAASCLVNVIGGVRQAMRVRRARRAAGEDDESHVLDAPVHPIDIEWRELRCELRTKKGVKKILRGLSGAAHPGRLLAIMGPSGSGKTTLLNALAGQVPQTKGMRLEGEVELNGTPQGRSHVCIGYVQQEDLFFSQLTVHETLMTAAQLRLPSSNPRDRAAQYVDSIITRLGLGKCRDTVVGDAKTRGLSGGEKKRLSIACELIGSPSVLFLDEPTSGLDAFQAERVMATLKGLASQGHTVVCSVHQPRSSIFASFDDLVLLSEGQCLYAGPASEAASHFASLGFPCPANYNPGDYLIDLVSVDYATKEAETATRARLDRLVEESVDLLRRPDGKGRASRPLLHDELVDTPGLEAPRSGFFRQMQLLFQRSLRQSLRDKATNFARLGASIGSAVIFGSIFRGLGRSQVAVQNRMGLLQVVAVQTAMSTVSKTLNIFPRERTIVSRERTKSAYQVGPYLLAKLMAELPVGAFFPALFGALVYPSCGLHRRLDRFATFLGIAVAESICAGSIGMAISSAAPTADAALVFGPLVMTIAVIANPIYVSERTLPRLLRWAPRTSVVKQAFEGLCANEMRGLTFDATQQGHVATGEQALERMGLSASPKDSLAALARLTLFNHWLTYTVLRARKPRFQTLQAPQKHRGQSGMESRPVSLPTSQTEHDTNALR